MNAHEVKQKLDDIRIYLGGGCWCLSGAKVTPPEEDKSK